MNLRSQGLAFSVLAWLIVVVSFWLPPLDAQTQLVVLSPIILLLGVPHGALDIVFVRQLANIRSMVGWFLFTGAYVASAAAVVVLWWIAPGLFLVAFLSVSVLHFSGDPEGNTSVLVRMLYGGVIVFCPLVLHATEVSQLFALLSGVPAANAITAALQWGARPWIGAIGLVALGGAKRNLPRSIELVSLTALLTFAPPLIGFALFFCGMHSARHILRTRDYSGTGTLAGLVRIASWPMLLTAAGVLIGLWLSDGTPLDMRLTQLLFVGLAALTVPHMIVVERVRFTGWALGSAAK